MVDTRFNLQRLRPYLPPSCIKVHWIRRKPSIKNLGEISRSWRYRIGEVSQFRSTDWKLHIWAWNMPTISPPAEMNYDKYVSVFREAHFLSANGCAEDG